MEGELDLICQRLGFSGPEDFAVTESDWQAGNIQSSSDFLPRLQETSSPIREETKNTVKRETVADLRERNAGGLRIRDETELPGAVPAPAESNGCLVDGGCRVVIVGGSGGGGDGGRGKGIEGMGPPLVLKPPPAMKLPVTDNGWSTWELFEGLAPANEKGSMIIEYVSPSNEEEEEEDKVSGLRSFASSSHEEEEEEEEEEYTSVVLGLRSFASSSHDDTTSTSSDAMNFSLYGRIRPDTTYWQKGNLLARGSFWSVYDGIAANGVFFAVKEISLSDYGSQGRLNIDQLEQEITLLNTFEHENIVQYYDTKKDESKLYIFLELVTQGSLLKLYQKFHLLDSQVSGYTRQILCGLKYLHDRNTIHRDIKCSNILIDVNGYVKLADFGLPLAIKLSDLLSCEGSAFWTPPEVVNKNYQGYGLPADIWSLGCTVLEMLTRQIPYSGLEEMAALFRIGKGEPPPIPDSLSKDARDFVLQCLQPMACNRPTAVQLLDHPFVKRRVDTCSGSASPHYLGGCR